MEEEMARYGYTKENLYTKDKRERKVIKKHLYQSTSRDENIWEEADEKMYVYITKELAKKLPNEIYLASTFDDSRIVFETEPDLAEKKNAIFGTIAPGKGRQGVPHLLFEIEVN